MTRGLREEAIVADHDANLAKARLEHRILVAGCDTRFNLRSRQRDLAILANEFAIRPDEYARIVNEMLFALDETSDEVNLMLACQVTEVLGRWTGNRLRGINVG